MKASVELKINVLQSVLDELECLNSFTRSEGVMTIYSNCESILQDYEFSPTKSIKTKRSDTFVRLINNYIELVNLGVGNVNNVLIKIRQYSELALSALVDTSKPI